MKGEIRKSLQIFIEDADTWEGQRLYEAIIHLLHKRGVAGATVWSGVMGYGAHGRIHRKGLFGVTDEKPILITAIDNEEAIRGVLPELLKMVKEGIVVLRDVELLTAVEQKAQSR